MSTPVSRSIELLTAAGYEVGIVQRSVPSKPFPISIDLFGVADLEALADDHTLYVQVCRDEDLAEHFATCMQTRVRRSKADTRPALRSVTALLRCEARRFEIWSWAKRVSGGRELWSERRYRALSMAGRVSFVEVAGEAA